MKETPTVTYYVRAERQSCEKLVHMINAAGFFCILQPIDFSTCRNTGVRIGGSSSQYHIIDLDAETIDNARFMVKMDPKLKGRTIVVESTPTAGLEAEGLISVPPNQIVDSLRRLHSAFNPPKR